MRQQVNNASLNLVTAKATREAPCCCVYKMLLDLKVTKKFKKCCHSESCDFTTMIASQDVGKNVKLTCEY